MAVRSGWRAGMVTSLVAGLVLVFPVSAIADAPDESGVVERAPELSAWIFWDGDGLIVLTGPPLTEGCVGEGFEFPIATTVNAPSGNTATSFSHTDQVWVYDDEGASDPLDWLFNHACGPVLAGEPGPELLADGEGRITVTYHTGTDGVLRGRQRVTAKVTTVDGHDVHVNVHGSLDELPDFINYGG